MSRNRGGGSLPRPNHRGVGRRQNVSNGTTNTTDAQKRRAVEQAFNGTPSKEIGDRLGVSASAIYIWCADKRYGGKPGGLSKQQGRAPRGANGPLPTIAKPPTTTAKSLVPTSWKCPHCGGRIRLEE